MNNETTSSVVQSVDNFMMPISSNVAATSDSTPSAVVRTLNDVTPPSMDRISSMNDSSGFPAHYFGQYAHAHRPYHQMGYWPYQLNLK